MSARSTAPVALSTTPTVSVVIPCYNYGHYLPTAVRSVATQDGVLVDVLIVDDCSTDDSFSVAQELTRKYDNVRAVRNEKNLGLIGTANAGLATVTGAYALLISADDALAPGALARAAALMEANPDVGLTYGPVTYVTDGELPEDAPAPASHWVVWEGTEWAKRLYGNAENQIYSPEAVVRTSIMREVGDYDPSVPYTSDVQMWLRFAARSSIGFIAGTVQAHYRLHGANMSMTQGGMAGDQRLLQELRHRMDAFESAAENFPRGKSYLAAARRAAADQALLLARIERDSGRDSEGYVAELTEFAATTDPSARRRIAWTESSARRLLVRALGRTGVRSMLHRLRERAAGRRGAREETTGVR